MGLNRPYPTTLHYNPAVPAGLNGPIRITGPFSLAEVDLNTSKPALGIKGYLRKRVNGTWQAAVEYPTWQATNRACAALTRADWLAGVELELAVVPLTSTTEAQVVCVPRDVAAASYYVAGEEASVFTPGEFTLSGSTWTPTGQNDLYYLSDNVYTTGIEGYATLNRGFRGTGLDLLVRTDPTHRYRVQLRAEGSSTWNTVLTATGAETGGIVSVRSLNAALTQYVRIAGYPGSGGYAVVHKIKII